MPADGPLFQFPSNTDSLIAFLWIFVGRKPEERTVGAALSAPADSTQTGRKERATAEATMGKNECLTSLWANDKTVTNTAAGIQAFCCSCCWDALFWSIYFTAQSAAKRPRPIVDSG